MMLNILIIFYSCLFLNLHVDVEYIHLYISLTEEY